MFRRLMLAIMLAFAGMMLVPGSAMAQQTPPPATTPQTQNNGGIAGWFVSDREEQTAKNYQEWRDYFQRGISTCWGCELFSATAKATIAMGQRGTDAFADPAAGAVASFMGLWVMWQLYLMLSVSHANSPAQSIDTIFSRLVVMMVVLYLLRLDDLFGAIMQPFLDSMGAVMKASSNLLASGGSRYGTCSNAAGTMPFVEQGNVLLCSMQKELGGGLGLGAWLMDSASFKIYRGEFDLFQWVMGLIIFAVFFFMVVILPFRFFDALVRIATVAAVLPLVIIAFLFKPTRGAVKQAATSLLTAMLMFLFTAVAIAIAVEVLHTVASTIFDNHDYAAEQDSWFGPIDASDFMVMLTAALGMASMIQSAGNLAAEFAGFQGQMGNAGSQGANMITGAANLAGKTAGGAAGAAFTGNRVASSVAKVIKPGSAG